MSILKKLKDLTRRSTLKLNDLLHVYSPETGKDHYVMLSDLLVQTGGYPQWNSTAAAAGDYDTGSTVTYGLKIWESLIDDNEDVPSEGASWTEVSDSYRPNVMTDCGNADLSGGNMPSTGGTGTGGAVARANFFYVTVGGTVSGLTIEPGARITAKANTPGNTLANWFIEY